MRPGCVLLATAVLLAACESGTPQGASETRIAAVDPDETRAEARAARRADVTPPRVVDARGTESTLTIVFSEPMLTGAICGASGKLIGGAGTIDAGNREEAAGQYRSPDLELDRALERIAGMSLNADCTEVTFEFAVGAPAGSYTLVVGGVQDLAGNPLDPNPSRIGVTIQDAVAPRVLAVTSNGRDLDIRFSEPMLRMAPPAGVLLASGYALDGRPLPAGTILGCVDEACAHVRLRLPAGILLGGATYTLTIAQQRDRAGKPLHPDPTTLRFTPVLPYRPPVEI